jgi:hypothetical protein
MKIKFFLCLFLLPCLLCGNQWDCEIRGGYFLPAEKIMREIYDTGGMEIEFEADRRFCNGFAVWGNVNYFTKTGHSIGLNSRTQVNIAPFSLGLKYILPLFGTLELYLGGGGTYSLVRFHDDSPFAIHRIKKDVFGLVGKSRNL